MSVNPLIPAQVQTSSTLTTAGNQAASAQGAGNIDSTATDFEAVFLSQMLGAMFSGESASSYFGGGVAGDVYKSTLADQYGKMIAQAGGIGIAASVKQELLKLQAKP